MAACPLGDECVFHQAVEPSVLKRIKYASVYPYCRGGGHGECAIYSQLTDARPVARNLMPDGSIGDYVDEERPAALRRRFLIIEDSPVYAALASSTIATHFADSEIVRELSYETAVERVVRETFAAIVCGYGLGGDRTAHDVRRLTAAPLVVLTGRPGNIELPHGARMVQKGAGPEALATALRAVLA
jgi:hypothetical protein